MDIRGETTTTRRIETSPDARDRLLHYLDNRSGERVPVRKDMSLATLKRTAYDHWVPTVWSHRPGGRDYVMRRPGINGEIICRPEEYREWFETFFESLPYETVLSVLFNQTVPYSQLKLGA